MAKICPKCKLPIETHEYAKCGECGNGFHFDCSVTENSYIKITKSKKWKCINCSARGPETRLRSAHTSTSIENENQNDPSEIKKILETINLKVNELDSIKSELQNLTKSVVFHAEQYDVLLEKVNEINGTLKNQNKIINKLQEENKEKDIVIYNLIDKIEHLEQYSRNKNIEIVGIPEKKGEDCKDIVIDMARELQMDIKKSDIDVAHRIHSAKPNVPRNIVAQFTNRTVRDQIINKKQLTITNNSINGSSIGTKIYINEHLTPYFKNLLRLAKIKKREADFKFVWFRNNKLLARKTENSPVIRLFNEKDINNKMIISPS